MNNQTLKTPQGPDTAAIFLSTRHADQSVAGVLPLVRLIHALETADIQNIICVIEDPEVASQFRGVPPNIRWTTQAQFFAERASQREAILLVHADQFFTPDALRRFVEQQCASRPVGAGGVIEENGEPTVGVLYLPADYESDGLQELVEAVFAGQLDEIDWHEMPPGDWQVLEGDGHRRAERMLSASIGNKPETLLGKWLNYPISSRLARVMARANVPVMVAQGFAALLLAASAGLAFLSSDYLLPAGLLFWIASFFDHASRDLATLTYGRTKANSLAGALVRYLGFGLFFGALGLNAFRGAGPDMYAFAVLFSTILWGYLTLIMVRFATSERGELAPILDVSNLAEVRRNSRNWWDRAVLSLDWLVRAESFPVIVVLLCAIGAQAPLFWMSCIALVGAVVSVLRVLSNEDHDAAKQISRSATTLLFFMVGLGLLALLIWRMPFHLVVDSISTVGPKVLWLMLMPVTWFVPNAAAVHVLLDKRAKFRDVLYAQVTGDSFNSLIPLMGLGGEPYKARRIGYFVPLELASRAIVQSRLVHAVSGVLFTAIILALTVAMVELDSRIAYAMGAISGAMLGIFFVLLKVTMSTMPSKATGFVLTKLKISEAYHDTPLTWRQFNWALMYKMVGRAMKFVELWLIFLLLGISPSIGDVLLVEAMIMAAASLFFVVPQGLGVNELGITTAFELAGYAATTGLAYGLIRRSRVLGYTVMGLCVLAVGSLCKFGQGRYVYKTVDETASATG